ncbi:MAG: hypothetical protein AB7T37_00880 [Dehalococcoidia bacterium]
MKTRQFAPALAAGLVLAMAGLVAAACGSGGTDPSMAAIAGITYLDSQPFHEFEVELTEKGTVPATAGTVARKAQAVLELTDWPSAVESDAKKLAALMGTFADEVEKDTVDVEAAKKASTDAHNAWHEFSHNVWDHLQEEAGVASGHGDDDHSHSGG